MKAPLATGLTTVTLLSLFAATQAMSADPPTAARNANNPSSDIRIHYADLDLSKPEDVHKLYGRVVRAAKLVCGSPVSFGGSTARMQDCVDKTVAHTVKQLDKPALSTYYARNTP
jgi:UrcA family protein